MRRRQFITATGAVGAGLASAGCTSVEAIPAIGRGEPTASSTGVTDTSAQVEDTTMAGQYIHVGATGQIEADPDTASIGAAIEATGDSASGVRDELATRTETLREELLDSGLEDEQLTTGRYDIREDHRTEGQYRGISQLRIEIDDVDAVGEVIDTAVAGGADEIDRVVFGITDGTRTELREQAIELAVENARREAEVVASAKGLTITGVQEVSTDSGRVRPYHARVGDGAAMETADDGAPPTQIDQGTVTVSANIEVTYRFEE